MIPRWNLNHSRFSLFSFGAAPTQSITALVLFCFQSNVGVSLEGQFLTNPLLSPRYPRAGFSHIFALSLGFSSLSVSQPSPNVVINKTWFLLLWMNSPLLQTLRWVSPALWVFLMPKNSAQQPFPHLWFSADWADPPWLWMKLSLSSIAHDWWTHCSLHFGKFIYIY